MPSSRTGTAKWERSPMARGRKGLPSRSKPRGCDVFPRRSLASLVPNTFFRYLGWTENSGEPNRRRQALKKHSASPGPIPTWSRQMWTRVLGFPSHHFHLHQFEFDVVTYLGHIGPSRNG